MASSPQSTQTNIDEASRDGTISTTVFDTSSKKDSRYTIFVNRRQKMNPIIQYIKDTPWEISDIIPDFTISYNKCVLFLSIRYHNLHPNYIHERIGQEGIKRFELKILLILIDIGSPKDTLIELTKIALRCEFTIILAYSNHEAAKYLETYKKYENKPPDMIMGRSESDFMSQVTECLTSIKSVNTTDANTLIKHFGSMARIIRASKDELLSCPGLGITKANRIHSTFHKRTTVKKLKLREQENELNTGNKDGKIV